MCNLLLAQYNYMHYACDIGGHLGRDKTLEKVCSRFYWGKGMTEEIIEYVRSCDVCQRVNDVFRKPATELHPIPVKSEVWTQVCKCSCSCT